MEFKGIRILFLQVPVNLYLFKKNLDAFSQAQVEINIYAEILR